MATDGDTEKQSDELRDRIRERAYALYLARHESGGTNVPDPDAAAAEDWVRAERELSDTVRSAQPVLNRDVGDGMSSGPEEMPDISEIRPANSSAKPIASPSDVAGNATRARRRA